MIPLRDAACEYYRGPAGMHDRYTLPAYNVAGKRYHR